MTPTDEFRLMAETPCCTPVVSTDLVYLGLNVQEVPEQEARYLVEVPEEARMDEIDNHMIHNLAYSFDLENLKPNLMKPY